MKDLQIICHSNRIENILSDASIETRLILENCLKNQQPSLDDIEKLFLTKGKDKQVVLKFADFLQKIATFKSRIFASKFNFMQFELIHSALQKVDLGEMLDRPIHTLSGGQKQRLALAGAIVSNSNLLLLDEPTALLDPQSQNSVLKVMKKLTSSSSNPITAIWVTHRLEELYFCDGAAILKNGRISQWNSGSKVFQELKSLALR